MLAEATQGPNPPHKTFQNTYFAPGSKGPRDEIKASISSTVDRYVIDAKKYDIIYI